MDTSTNNQTLIYLSENQKEMAKEYWKQFRFPQRKQKRKQEMIEIIKSGAKDGLMFEFGYPDVPKGYAVFSELPKKYQQVISAYLVLAHELSDKQTKYVLDYSDFLFNQKNGSIRAKIRKVNLENLVN